MFIFKKKGKMKKILLFLAIFWLGFFTFLEPGRALVITDQETVTIGPGEVINDDLFVSGGTVSVSGTVNGTVFAAGGVVSVDGMVTGDVVMAGGNATISGVVEDDVWVVGGNIQITEAQIGDGLLVAGGMIQIDESSAVGGSLLAAGGSVFNSAAVGRNFFAGGGEVRLNAPVGGEVRVGGERLVIGKETVVGGDLVYEAGEAFELDPQATVSGKVRESVLDLQGVTPRARQSAGTVFRGARSVFRLWSFLSALAVGLVLTALLPKPMAKIGEQLSGQPFRAALAGLVTFVLAGPVVILLLITLIGIPLGLITATLFGVYLYLAKIFAAAGLGEGLKGVFEKKKMSPYASISLGLLTYYFLLLIPFIGFLARLAAGLVGLGAAYLYWRRASGRAAAKKS